MAEVGAIALRDEDVRQAEVGGAVVYYQDEASFRTARRNIYEQRVYHFVAESARPRVVDGGAHIGLATLYFKKLYPQSQVICFEPDPAAVRLLRRNLAANGLTDVEVVEAGLSDRTGTAGFWSDGRDGGRLTGEGGRADRVRTVRLSDYLRTPADFVKLNIEGAEGPVLRDLDRHGTLRQIQELVIEYHGWPGGPQPLGSILEVLDRHGFRYLVHDFDRETNPASKPPFRLRPETPWFCLVYARRGGPPAAGDRQHCEESARGDEVD